MKLTVVGYWGAFPSKNEATSGYLIEKGNKKILLDCGSGVVSQLQNYILLEELDAVFITHIHTDHIADLHTLEFAALVQSQLKRRKKPLDFYIYGESIEHLPFQFFDYINVYPLTEGDLIQVGELSVECTPTVHEISCCAFKITSSDHKVIVYSGDTGYFEGLVDFARNADILLIESSFYNKQKGFVKGHLTAGEAGEIAAKANVKEVILTHLPHFGDVQLLIEEASKSFGSQVALASSGMKRIL